MELDYLKSSNISIYLYNKRGDYIVNILLYSIVWFDIMTSWLINIIDNGQSMKYSHNVQ